MVVGPPQMLGARPCGPGSKFIVHHYYTLATRGMLMLIFLYTKSMAKQNKTKFLPLTNSQVAQMD